MQEHAHHHTVHALCKNIYTRSISTIFLIHRLTARPGVLLFHLGCYVVDSSGRKSVGAKRIVAESAADSRTRVCTRVCVCVRERERERNRTLLEYSPEICKRRHRDDQAWLGFIMKKEMIMGREEGRAGESL